MKDRMTLGRDADVAETAALTLADERATDRIVEAQDWEHDEMERRQALDDALGGLGKTDRAFAKAVLKRKSWSDMCISRQAFWKRMKKLEIFFDRINKGRN